MKIQMFSFKKSIFFLILFALTVLPLSSDQREENIDLFLVLDKSKSMVQEIGEVKRYVNDFLFDSFLIPGDRVTVILFYGKTEVLFSGLVENDVDKAPLLRDVEALRADGRFTDIGNALDRLKSTLDEEPPRDLHKYLLLITDGIQEAPPESPYYSPDGSFNHRFLENTKTIQKRGWKIQIIGIGTDTAAREIAEELSGVYAEVTGKITAEKLEEATGQILGMIQPLSDPTLSRIDEKGAAMFDLDLVSSGYDDEKTIEINGVRFETTGGAIFQVLDIPEDQAVALTLPAGGEAKLTLPLSFANVPGNGTVEGSLALRFSGEIPITPAVFPVVLDRTSPAEIPEKISFMPLLIGGAAVILLLVILLIIRSLKGRGESSVPSRALSCVVEGALKGSRDIRLSAGEHFFLKKDSFGITFTKEEVENPLAKITLRQGGTFFELMSEKELIPISKLEGDILDRLLSFRLKDNQRITIRIRNKK